MKLSLAVLALGVTPAFSYLASLEKTNVAVPAAPPAPFVGEASSGIKSYLDALTTSPASTTSGPGMASYLDALPKNPSGLSGAGLPSYAESLNVAGAAAAPVVEPAAPAPAEPTSFDESGNAAAAASNYLEALASGTAISGAGITGYLDALPRSASLTGGAGMQGYLDALPRSASLSGGAGIQTHTDGLSGGSKAFVKPSYSPSGSSAPAFAMGSVTGSFDFAFEADSAILEKIAAAGGRKVVLSGTVEAVSYN